MNIHALLSMHQGQSNTAAPAARSGDAQANGFMQAFSQASHTSLSHGAQATSGNAKSGGGSVSLQQIADQLQALGLSEEQLNQADMQALMKQIRQQPELMNALQALTASLNDNAGADALLGNELFEGELSDSASPLTEITQRLQLMSAFDTPNSLEPSDSSNMLLARFLDLDSKSMSPEALLNTLNKGGNAPLSEEQQQLARTLTSALERLDTEQHPQATSLATLFNAIDEGSNTPLSEEQQQLARTLASVLEHLDTQPQPNTPGDGSILSDQLAALLGGVAAMQTNSAQTTTANDDTKSSASTLFSPSLAAMRASAQASDATSQSEAANRALSLLDGASANNASRISSDALLAALASTNNSTPAPNFELPAALQASLNGAGTSSAATLQNSASGLSQGAAAQGSVATPVSSPAWPQQLGQQLVQFAQRGGEQHVKLQLHPAELGPLSISLKVGEQGTQAHFLSAHAQVRQVVEQAIPQLREALAEQGISLGETSVGEQRQQNGESELAEGGSNAAGQAGNTLEGGSEDASEPTSLQPRTVAIDGRVDLYA